MKACLKNYKRIISVLILLLGMAAGIGAATRMGDVNSNSTVDVIDSLLIAQYTVGLPLTNFDANVTDFNYDGSIRITDALVVAQFSAGLAPDSTCQPNQKTVYYVDANNGSDIEFQKNILGVSVSL